MIRKQYRLLAILLGLLLLAIHATACSSPAQPPMESDTLTQTSEDTEAETVDEIEEALTRIGEVDWGGRDFTVLLAEASSAEVKGMETAQGGSVLDDAVYERNALFADTCRLQFATVVKTADALNDQLQNQSMSGDQDIHLCMNSTFSCAGISTTGCLYNYLDFSSIDYTKPWWDQGTLSFNLAGNVFFMSGAHNYEDNDFTYAIIFNKDLATEHQLPDLYATVDNNEWTADLFLSLVKNLSADNGDGKWDDQDFYGLGTSYEIGDMLFYGTGMQLVTYDQETELPILALDSSHMEKALEILKIAQRVVHENNATYMWKVTGATHQNELFIEDRMVFNTEGVGALPDFNAAMESDFGVLPMPKYDQTQERYYTYAWGGGSTMCIPGSIEANESFEKVLETFVVLSHKTITPAYYDVVLGSRAVRDPESAQVLDILFANRIYDMPQYFSQLGMSNLFNDAVQKNTDSFSSSYKRVSGRFDATVEQILEKLT